LTDRPVDARPPSTTYRFAKFVRRNRWALVVAGLLAASLLVGTGLTAWQAVRATRAGRRARGRHQVAGTPRREMYSGGGQGWVADQPHRTLTQEKFLARTLAFYERFAAERADTPDERYRAAVASYRAAHVRRAFGKFREAESLSREAVDCLKVLSGQFP